MPDSIDRFEQARSDDRVVSADDVSSTLNDLTLDDWRAIAGRYDNASALVNNFHVKESADAFTIHNDPDAIKDSRVTSGAWGLVRGVGLTGLGLGLGQIAMRLTPYGRIGGTALGALSGYMMYRSEQNHIDNLEKTSFPLTVPKSGLRLD